MSQEKKNSTSINLSDSSQAADTVTDVDSLDDCSLNHHHEDDSETDSR